VLTIEMNDPKFVVTQSFEVVTDRGTILIMESEPCSFVFDPDGDIFIGNGGTVLRVEHTTALTDLLSMISPATFQLVAEEDGEVSLCATLVEPKQVFLPSETDEHFSDVARIVSIRPFEGIEGV
jgi:hypothetical protein